MRQPAGAYFTLFEPVTATAGIAATTTSARVAIGTFNENETDYPRIVSVGSETGGSDVYIKFGDSSVTATLQGGPLVYAGHSRGFRVPAGATHIAAITRSGTATVNVILGRGF